MMSLMLNAMSSNKMFAKTGFYFIEIKNWGNGNITPIIQAAQNYGHPVIHSIVYSHMEFMASIEEWLTLPLYKTLYISSHGEPGHIIINNKKVSLMALGEKLETYAKGRIIHFSSCDTLNISDPILKQFFHATQLAGISGYRKDIKWDDSVEFERDYFDFISKFNIITNKDPSYRTIPIHAFYEVNRRNRIGFVYKSCHFK